MTRQDLIRIYSMVSHCKVGYCCYQEDNKSQFSLVNLGCNSGIYGWNWSALLDPKTDTLYVSCYRNVPSCIVNK